LPGNKKTGIFIRIIKIFAVFLALVIILSIITAGIIINLNSPLQPEKMPQITNEIDGIKKMEDGTYLIDIRRGESSQSAGMRLERAGLIKNRYLWNLLCKLEKEHIKNGIYKIEIPVNMLAVHRILISGKQILYRVTIPEGVTLTKMAVILEEAGICSADDFLLKARDSQILNEYRIPNDSMEGYLFPDTYLFSASYPAEKVISAMADNFYKRIINIDSLSVNLSSQQLNEKVILASIVEREYRINEEAPLMAGVFYNRLKINMPLQSCATVEYIITEILGKPHPSVIYNQDLEIRNPYNTYNRTGLPPGPISAPGAVALRAVFFPENSDFFYFRLDDAASGRHYFSKTHDEHIRAGQLFTKSQL